MDDKRFDRIVKSFAAPRTRRTVFKTIGAAVISTFAIDRANDAEAASSRGPGAICRKPTDCDSGICGQPDYTGRRRCDCPSGYQACGDNCVDPAGFQRDAANCGSCGRRCAAGQICCNGACAPATSACGATCCTSPQVCYQSTCCLPNDRSVTCSGKCGPQTNNCGQPVTCDPCCTSAGQPCTTNTGCCSGTCLNGTCAAGPSQPGGPCDETADCQSGVCCNAICVATASFQSDLANCGACGAACPTAAPECGTATCVSGVCGGTFASNGTRTESQTPGDCHATVCNGAGQIVTIVDDDDRPTTSSTCLVGTCSNGTQAVVPVDAGESCAENCGSICDGAGTCVSCIPGTPIPCYTGPSGTVRVGICREGTKTCNAQGTGYGACIGEVVPGNETTCNGLDDDCDGVIDNGVCAPIPQGTSGCIGNECGIVSCDPGYGNCNGIVADGCETNLLTDVDHCGDCGAACSHPGECVEAGCADGSCFANPVASGVPITAQIAGDCKQVVCDGAGGESTIPDDSDAPIDVGTGCTTTICVSGEPVPSNKPLDAVCAENGGSYCDGLGSCVECTNNGQCDSNVCLPDNSCCVVLPFADFCGSQCGQIDGACQSEYCGDCCAENGQSCGDNLDCCSHVCVDNTCVEGPIENGDPCDDSDDCRSGECCGGVCVDISAFDDDLQNCGSCGNVCTGPLTECEEPVCVAGGCTTGYADYGTELTAQVTGDCQKDICDGAGGYTTTADDFDTPADDGSGCMEPACDAGSPTTRPRSPGAPCDEDGGSYCDGDGFCVECISGFTCPSEVCLPDNTCCVVLTVEEFCAGQCGTVVGDCQTEECPCGCEEGYETGSDGVTCVPTQATCDATLALAQPLLQNADFRECNFAGYEFGMIYLVLADFTGANLAGASLIRTSVADSVFDGANLSGVRWQLAVCPDAYTIPNFSSETCCGHLNGSVPAACS